MNAVVSAAKEVGAAYADLGQQVLEVLLEVLPDEGEVTVEEIQEQVELALMDLDPHTARAYIEYRRLRDLAREKKTEFNEDVLGLLEQTDKNLLTENANKDSTVIPTQRDLLAGITSKHYAKKYILPKDIVQAHDTGDIHYHDLDYSPAGSYYNCMLINLEEMFKGFKMGNAQIETPKSIETAAAVTSQIIAQVASHIYGGNTLDRLDEVFAPYVTKTFDKHLAIAKEWGIRDAKGFAMTQTKKSCYDAFQAIEYETNTMQTANGQTPFSTIGFGLGTSWQSRMIQKAILKVRLKGLGKTEKTAIFPKLTFTIKDGVNHRPEDPNYDIKQLALECASKRIYPDILNYEQIVEKTGSFKAPMGCRSFLGQYINEKGEEEHSGRNNMGVVSLNLPRLALRASHDLDHFYDLLDEKLLLVKRALMTRIDRLSTVQAKVAPILYMEGATGHRLQADDYVLDLFKDGRASISVGYIGIHETMKALYGADSTLYEDKKLQNIAVNIVAHMKDTVDAWKEETGWGFSLYSTPSENLCDRFCRLDQKEFGIIKGVTDKGYYTNSFHLDVEQDTNPYDKLDFEMHYPEFASGGFICYVEQPSLQNNLKALEDLWDYSYTRVPYLGVNQPVDQCFSCGFSGEFTATSKGFVCPNCGCHDDDKISVIRRVCGYLGNPTSRGFNEGKQEEVQRRVKHK